jgi:MFS family permease
VAYFLEGMVYFGMVGYLSMYFSQYVGLGEVQASWSVGAQTWGITLAMVLFGGLADKWGVRIALAAAFCLMIVGRSLLALGPTLGWSAGGLGSPVHLLAMLGILFIVLGYGMYQPAAYAGVRQVTTPQTAAMGFAMLYALMNFGGWCNTFFAPIRRSIGIHGVYWIYTCISALALILTLVILSRRTVEQAVAAAKSAAPPRKGSDKSEREPGGGEIEKRPFSLGEWLRNHPLANPKFAVFIFSLMPVQTLFAYFWLTFAKYLQRGYRGTWIGDNFEAVLNLNSILIFIFVPIVAALTRKRKVYNMMILGTLIMAVPTFFLALGPRPLTVVLYVVVMTVGEAIWQPRFLQYAAELAPEGKTGAYTGVAQLPWFLTKVLTSIYAGWFLETYCPAEGELNTETMWFISACIAMCTPIFLIFAKGWLGRDFKTHAA